MDVDPKPIARTPGEYSSDEFAAFAAMVESEGEVAGNLPARMMRAVALVMLNREGALAGTAAIKRPDPVYRGGVFRKAESAGDPRDYPVELGWIVVGTSHRGAGLSRILVEAALAEVPDGQRAFATTRSSNAAMHRILPAFGFVASGKPYPSREHPGETIQLYVRDVATAQQRTA